VTVPSSPLIIEKYRLLIVTIPNSTD